MRMPAGESVLDESPRSRAASTLRTVGIRDSFTSPRRGTAGSGVSRAVGGRFAAALSAASMSGHYHAPVKWQYAGFESTSPTTA